jgi:hypothetical protein
MNDTLEHVYLSSNLTELSTGLQTDRKWLTFCGLDVTRELPTVVVSCVIMLIYTMRI